MGVLLGQKNCRTKVSRIFGIFVPDFAPNFAPNFPRIFRGFFALRFVGNGDQKKFTKNPRHFSMQNSQANTKKIFTKRFWREGKVMFCKQLFSSQLQDFKEKVASKKANFSFKSLSSKRVTLLVGIEMSSFGSRDFSIFFSVSRSSLTSSWQDVEAQKKNAQVEPRKKTI